MFEWYYSHDDLGRLCERQIVPERAIRKQSRTLDEIGSWVISKGSAVYFLSNLFQSCSLSRKNIPNLRIHLLL